VEGLRELAKPGLSRKQAGITRFASVATSGLFRTRARELEHAPELITGNWSWSHVGVQDSQQRSGSAARPDARDRVAKRRRDSAVGSHVRVWSRSVVDHGLDPSLVTISVRVREGLGKIDRDSSRAGRGERWIGPAGTSPSEDRADRR